MELHYLTNKTMKGIADDYFLSTVPDSFLPIEHNSSVWTSGNFCKDGYCDLVTQKTSAALELIKTKPDGAIIVWSDVDVIFFRDFSDEIISLMGDADVIFQREWWHDDMEVNTGFQIIRCSEKTARLYSEVLSNQNSGTERRQQPWFNWILRNSDYVYWRTLPVDYSSESNGGLSMNSRIYHANCTGSDSINQKRRLLDVAMGVRASASIR